MPRYVLHSYYRSSSAYRVRIALAHKGIPYRYEAVHLLRGGGEQNTAAFKALNPMGQVPVLVVLDDAGESIAALGQSVAILEYLEERHPEPALLPQDPLDRARVRQLVECVVSGIQPIQNLAVLQSLSERFDTDRAANARWARDWIARGFDALESLLVPSAGVHTFGDAVTLADAVLVPQVYNARRFGVDMTAFPTISRVDATAQKLPSFQAAAPDCQPDAPPAQER